MSARVRFLTVDEYQDVNPIQERLIRALADLGATLTVVGDDDQLLYAWRGSSVGKHPGLRRPVRRRAERAAGEELPL